MLLEKFWYPLLLTPSFQLSVLCWWDRSFYPEYNTQFMCFSPKQYYFITFQPILQTFIGLPTINFYKTVNIPFILILATFIWWYQCYIEKHLSMLELTSFPGCSAFWTFYWLPRILPLRSGAVSVPFCFGVLILGSSQHHKMYFSFFLWDQTVLF